MKNKYSIVVPVYNEQESVPLFYQAITPIMDALNEDYEVVFVNDGSKDNTLSILKELSQQDKRIKVVNFSRNFGQMNAIFCGLEYASGDAMVIMDVDLQDPVETIPLMIEKWKEGYEIVHGKRKKRKGESLFKKVTSAMYLKFLKMISGLNIPKNVGEFKLLDRKVVDVLVNMPEHDRYLREATAWAGFKQTSVEFVRQERHAGETKYSLKKMVRLATRSIVNMSTWPLTLSMKAGFLFGFLSVACFITFIVLTCCKIILPLTAWIFPTIVFMFSISFVLNGMTNVYLKKTYEESKNRPRYIVAETINIDKE